MLQFEEYKVKLNNLKPEIEGLDKALGIEQAKREVEELEIKSSQPGFWENGGNGGTGSNGQKGAVGKDGENTDDDGNKILEESPFVNITSWDQTAGSVAFKMKAFATRVR